MFSGTRVEEEVALARIAASLERMRSGVRAVLAGLALCAVAAALSFHALPDATGEAPGLSGPWIPTAVALGAVGYLAQIVGILWGFVPGTRSLARVRHEFATASAVIRVRFLEGLAALLLVLLLLPLVWGALPVLLMGVVLIRVPAVPVMLGHVFLPLLGVRMYRALGDPRYLAFGLLAGLLLLVFPVYLVLAILHALSIPPGSGAPVSAVCCAVYALNLIAWALLYSALGRSVGRPPRRLAREPVL